jgi:hypothetical protein
LDPLRVRIARLDLVQTKRVHACSAPPARSGEMPTVQPGSPAPERGRQSSVN